MHEPPPRVPPSLRVTPSRIRPWTEKMYKFLQRFRSTSSNSCESDFGRRFGWFVERYGDCIGELEYLRWDENSQFWHEYLIRWRNTQSAPTRVEDWVECGIGLRNRGFSDVVVRDFLSAPGSAEGLVLIRNAFVPDDHFRESTNIMRTVFLALAILVAWKLVRTDWLVVCPWEGYGDSVPG